MKTRNRYIRTDKQIKKTVEEEVSRMYPIISRDVAYQVFAVTFLVLNREYGFGEKRLNNLKEQIEMEYFKMQESPLGVKYNPDDAIRICKERFGIDFYKSIFDTEEQKNG